MFYNQESWTKKCIEYLEKNTNKELFDLVLLDNASSEDSSERVKEYASSLFPELKFKRNEYRIPISLLYNESIKEFSYDSERFVILHNDVLVSEGWLESLNGCADYFQEKRIKFSCIYPRTNYAIEGTPSYLDEDIKEVFLENKVSNKSFHSNESIQECLDMTYILKPFEDHSLFVKNNNKGQYKINEEICVFCTLFNTESFMENGMFDEDMIGRGCESKILNIKEMSNDHYPILAVDVYVHHNGNTTSDGVGMDFGEMFKEENLLFENKKNEYIINEKKKIKFESDLQKGKRILFIRDSGIGDIIMSMFTIQAIKNRFPKSKIDFMTNLDFMDFVSRFDCIDKVLPFDEPEILFYDKKEKIQQYQENPYFKENYDIVFNWLRYVEYFDLRDEHRVIKFLDSVDIDGLKPNMPVYNFSDEDTLNEIPKEPYVVVCYQSSCNARTMPDETWRAIVEEESHTNNVIIVGNKDNVNKEGFTNQDKIFDFGLSLSLEKLPYILKNSQRVYAPDSGVLHMSALVGAPTVSFFGAIDPKLRLGYYENDNIVLYKEKELHCIPCKDKGCKDRPCLSYSNKEIKQLVKGNV